MYKEVYKKENLSWEEARIEAKAFVQMLAKLIYFKL